MVCCQVVFSQSKESLPEEMLITSWAVMLQKARCLFLSLSAHFISKISPYKLRRGCEYATGWWIKKTGNSVKYLHSFKACAASLKCFCFPKISNTLWLSPLAFSFSTRGDLQAQSQRLVEKQNHTSDFIKITPSICSTSTPRMCWTTCSYMHMWTQMYNCSRAYSTTPRHSLKTTHTPSQRNVVSSALFLDYCL